MKKAYMLCLGLIKSFSSLRLEPTHQGKVQHTEYDTKQIDILKCKNFTPFGLQNKQVFPFQVACPTSGF